MIVRLIKQKNPEHAFYIPYLQPIKANAEKENMQLELEEYILPKEAIILADSNGVEHIFVEGMPVSVMADIEKGGVYLVNAQTFLPMEKVGAMDSGRKIIRFPQKQVALNGA